MTCYSVQTRNLLKTVSKRAIQKGKEATGDSIGNKIADRIKKVSETSSQNNSKENIEHDRQIHRQHIYIFISRIKTENYWWFKIYIIRIDNNRISKT